MRRPVVLLLIFLLSGFAALVYQVVWQRALFAIYGIDMASVTVVVTAFMVGLGLGSLSGGELSRRLPALPLFAAIELGIGAFGFWSLDVFAWAGRATLGADHATAGAVTFALVLLPTTLMGATLPLLTAFAAPRTGNTGRTVGALYFANTLGAAISCFATAWLLLGGLGMRGATAAAAALNVVLAGAVVLLWRREAGALPHDRG